MSETAKVRLVRCPKCENLLPEVTDYSVYQCGGCGAVLRAKNKGAEMDTFSEKSDEERIGGNLEKISDTYENLMNVSERRTLDMSDGSESDLRSSISSSSRAERRRRILQESNRTSKEEKQEVEADVIQDEFHPTKVTRGFEDLAMCDDNGNGLRRQARVVNGRNEEKNEMDSFWRDQRMDEQVMRASSSVLSRSSYEYENPVENVGDDRAELLKKLDELKDQLSRSGNLVDKGKEKVPFDRRMPPQDPYAPEHWYPDAQFKRPPYQNHYAEPPPLMRRPEMGGNGFYPPQHASIHGQGYDDPLRSHMHRRGPPPYQMPSSHAYMSGPYMDGGVVYMDTMEPYPPNFSRHHPSCSCHQCRTKRHVSTPILPTAYSDYHDNPGSFGSRDYLRSHIGQTHARWPSDVNSEADGYMHRRPQRLHLASGAKSCLPIAGGAPFLTCYSCFELLLLPKKVFAKTRMKLRCGACSTVIAFAISNKKLVVLLDVEAKDTRTPVKVDNNVDGRLNQARTALSSEDYDNSGYDFHSMDEPRANKSAEIKNRRSTSTYTSEAEDDIERSTVARKGGLSREDKKPPPPAGLSLQDYFEYSNKYHVVKDTGEGNRSGRSENEKVLPNKATTRQILRKESSATEIDLSLNEYSNTGTTFDSSEASREGDRLKVGRGAESFFAGEGNRSGRSENEKVLPNKATARQILRKESSATEIDLSSNEYSNTGTTFDSSEASRGREAESFFAGIMKKSFKDSQRSKDKFEQETANVTVNGHLISDRLIKKAEKLAGPIQPGHYWYDFRAGFWGAIGGPCLGIIPPFIEELNYSMPEHCAGGNTRVFVNGRELNQKDLRLLGSRGLPTERDRSYIIEISGRVLDEDTGEELESLGKLAPTVERTKRGFGMRDPKAAA